MWSLAIYVDVDAEPASLNSVLTEEIRSKEAAFTILTRELEELKLKGASLIYYLIYDNYNYFVHLYTDNNYYVGIIIHEWVADCSSIVVSTYCSL